VIASFESTVWFYCCRKSIGFDAAGHQYNFKHWPAPLKQHHCQRENPGLEQTKGGRSGRSLPG